ncbi:MAG: hypothetical protein CMK50_03740 [Propionibacteriaceae bacterium]|nr:hypothetical protein [Propionibacteriaceae bacterium]
MQVRKADHLEQRVVVPDRERKRLRGAIVRGAVVHAQADEIIGLHTPSLRGHRHVEDLRRLGRSDAVSPRPSRACAVYKSRRKGDHLVVKLP